jgi:hypothetical protein
VFYPVAFNEQRHNYYGYTTTGAGPSGAVAATCANWTSTTSPEGATVGSGLGGPVSWTTKGNVAACTNSMRLLCMGTTSLLAPPPPVPPLGAKKVWLSNTPYLIGAQTPDQKCNAERPAGVTAAVALISKGGVPAANLLSAVTTYVRPDGAVVGTGAEISGVGSLQSGIWQVADGTYVDANAATGLGVWTGSTSTALAATTDGSCDNWTSASAAGAPSVGDPSLADAQFWSSYTNSALRSCNTTTNRLYCLQAAP